VYTFGLALEDVVAIALDGGQLETVVRPLITGAADLDSDGDGTFDALSVAVAFDTAATGGLR
jgi:hypothetical protein